VRWHPPTPHVREPMLLSTVPSQSSSMLLHVSALPGSGLQAVGTPFVQAGTELVQGPTPHVVVPRFSSTAASQSSSRPLQASIAPGWTAAT
jgi:hypothetical protein